MACSKRDIVGYVRLETECALDFSGKPKRALSAAKLPRGIRAERFACRVCQDQFTDWKTARTHRKP